MSSPRASFWHTTLAAAFFTPFGVPAFANTHPEALSDTAEERVSPPVEKVFRFNVSPNGYPPYLITEGDQTSGIMWTVVEEIAIRLGYRVEAHKMPHKRVEQMLLSEFIDGTARAKEWTEKPEDFVFSDPVVQTEEVIFFPAGSPHSFRVIEDLFSLTLVAHLGYTYPGLEHHFKSGKITRFDVPRDKDLFLYASQGDDLDAAISDRLVGQWILYQQGMKDQFRTSSSILSEAGYRIMLRPGLETFADAFNRELAQMRNSGRIEEIVSKYR